MILQKKTEQKQNRNGNSIKTNDLNYSSTAKKNNFINYLLPTVFSKKYI